MKTSFDISKDVRLACWCIVIVCGMALLLALCGCMSAQEIKTARFEQSVNAAQADPAIQAAIAQGIVAGKAALASQRQ